MVTAEAAAEKVVFQGVAAEVVAEAVAEGPGAVVAAEVAGVAVLLGVNLEVAVADDRFCVLPLEKCLLIIVQVTCNLTNYVLFLTCFLFCMQLVTVKQSL